MRKDRSHDHYCKDCGITILERDIERLKGVLLQLRGEDDLDPEEDDDE